MVMSSEILKLASELNEAVIAYRSVVDFLKEERANAAADAADRLTGLLLEFINDQPELKQTNWWRVTYERPEGERRVWCETSSEKEAKHEYGALTVAGPRFKNVVLQSLWSATHSEWQDVWPNSKPAEGN